MKQLLALCLSVVLAMPACAMNVAQKMESSTVLLHMKIRRDRDGEEGWGTCSGVYVNKNIILSAAHCVNMPEGISIEQLWVRQNDGMSDKAIVLKIDTSVDLSLLYTPLEGTPVKLAKRVTKGETCFAIGNPLGLNDTITKGIVSKTNLEMDGFKATFLVLDCVVLPGNSGGAVVDKKGHLIGIVSMSTSILGIFGASGLGLAVSLKDIKEFIK